MRGVLVVLGVVVAGGLGGCATVEGPGVDGAAVYARMLEAYGGLESYADEGAGTHSLPGSEQTILFKTFFARPDRLRFEFLTHHPYPLLRHITTSHEITFDGTAVHSFWNGEAWEARSLDAALAGATGISGGIAPLVPSLLLPQELAGGIRHLTRVRLAGMEEVEGVPCYRLVGTRGTGHEITLFVSREDLLIRKALLAGDREIRYTRITVNEGMDPEVFRPQR